MTASLKQFQLNSIGITVIFTEGHVLLLFSNIVMRCYLHELGAELELSNSLNIKDVLSLQYPYTLELCFRATEIGILPEDVLVKRKISDPVLQKHLLEILLASSKQEYTRNPLSHDFARLLTINEHSFPKEKLVLTDTRNQRNRRYFEFGSPIGNLFKNIQPPDWLSPGLKIKWMDSLPTKVGVCLLPNGAAAVGMSGYGHAIRLYSPERLEWIQISQLHRLGLHPRSRQTHKAYHGKTRETNPIKFKRKL